MTERRAPLWRSWWVRGGAAAAGFVTGVARTGMSARGVAASLVLPLAVVLSGWWIDRYRPEP